MLDEYFLLIFLGIGVLFIGEVVVIIFWLILGLYIVNGFVEELIGFKLL